MFEIKVNRSEFDAAMKSLEAMRPAQQRGTLRKAVNDTVRELEKHMRDQIGRYVDRPVRATLSSLRSNYASSKGDRVDGGIEFRSDLKKKFLSYHWLYWMVFGLPRRDKGLERALRHFGFLPAGYMAVPSSAIRTDGHGNVPGKYITTMLSYLRMNFSGANRPTTFQNKRQVNREIRRRERWFIVPVGAKNNLDPGIYEYRGTGFGKAVRLAYGFRPVSYRQTFPFHAIANRFTLSIFPARLYERMAQALRGGGGQ